MDVWRLAPITTPSQRRASGPSRCLAAVRRRGTAINGVSACKSSAVVDAPHLVIAIVEDEINSIMLL